jgi:hypothetical protein
VSSHALCSQHVVYIHSPPLTPFIRHVAIRQVGIHGKQTSALFSALSCRNTFTRNVAYNG